MDGRGLENGFARFLTRSPILHVRVVKKLPPAFGAGAILYSVLTDGSGPFIQAPDQFDFLYRHGLAQFGKVHVEEGDGLNSFEEVEDAVVLVGAVDVV